MEKFEHNNPSSATPPLPTCDRNRYVWGVVSNGKCHSKQFMWQLIMNKFCKYDKGLSNCMIPNILWSPPSTTLATLTLSDKVYLNVEKFTWPPSRDGLFDGLIGTPIQSLGHQRSHTTRNLPAGQTVLDKRSITQPIKLGRKIISVRNTIYNEHTPSNIHNIRHAHTKEFDLTPC